MNTPSIPTDHSGSLPLRTSIFTVLLCMFFGANSVAVKISLTGLGIYTTAGIRFGGAALFLLTWAYFTHKPLRISRKQLGQMALFTLVFFFQITTFYRGLRLTSASHGVLIANILPFVVMILAHYLLPNDRITKKKVLGLFLGFTGVSLLFLESLAGNAHSSTQGNLLIALGVFLWGCNAVYIKKIIDDYTALQITLYPMLIGAPFYLASGYFFDQQMVIGLNSSVIAAMFYQTFVTASIGFVLWNSLIRQYGATAVHSFIFIMPVSGVFFGVVLLDEPVTFALLGSIALVSLGLVVINRQ